MSETIRWGILGTGAIAHKFAEALAVVPNAELSAVGSRAQGTADAFGDEFAVPRRHASYLSLAEDPEVDAIYVSSPHPMHCRDTLLCLYADKPVLCEKPFALNASEAEAMIRCARQRGLFLMEAMWTRFLPAIAQVREWLADGAIGEVRNMMADFGFRADFNPEGRLLNPELGGVPSWTSVYTLYLWLPWYTGNIRTGSRRWRISARPGSMSRPPWPFATTRAPWPR